MADISTPAREYSSAPPNPSGAGQSYEEQVVSWVTAALEEGEAILKSEPGYEEIERNVSFVMGDQLDPKRPAQLANVVDNRTKRIVLQTVSALTDIHPLFGFKTLNPNFQSQSDVLDKLSRAWWTNSMADIQLGHVIRYAAVMGAGYCEVQWNPGSGGGVGDIQLVPRDFRDVVPIRPTFDDSIQNWEGVIIRTSRSVNEMRARFKDKAYAITPDRTENFITKMWRRGASTMRKKVVVSAVDHLTAAQGSVNAMPKSPSLDVFHVYFKDRSLHTGGGPITIGDPDTSWSYTVYPIGFEKEDGSKATEEDARLYPRGRHIICTRKVVLFDGPNPYWHGMFPLARLRLDPWPWSLMGGSIVRDIMPLQDGINEMINGIFDACRKALRPGVVANQKTVPRNLWERLDTRLAGIKLLKSRNTMEKDAITFTDPPELPAYVMDFLQFLLGETEYLTDVANLQQFAQLQQTPGADTIEKMIESMTPLIRMRGRLLEGFLREIGEMVKSCFFQFYTMRRRISMLGEAGIDFADFDFDPGTLVPAMVEGDDDYMPEYDKQKTTPAQRAQVHQKQFTFQITPNSLLAVSQLSRKLLYLQLWRGGLMDPWTLFEVLEVPNGGSPPNEATSIIDRLMAAQMLGLMGSVSPAGRKATGQESPQMQVKGDQDGNPRVVISESGGGGG